MGMLIADIAELSLILVLAVLSVPTLVLLVQVLAARMCEAGVEGADDSPGDRPRLAVLMPAHDEATGITAAIKSVLPQLAGGDRLVVVADNCTDDTAAVARAAGARVIERHDPLRRGKGYALDFGVRYLQADPPEVVVIVDADCHLHEGSLTRLSAGCAATGRPLQALDLMRAPAGAGLKTRIGELAWIVKNHVRPLGYHRMALPCQLMGTGMAFPWALICNAPLASREIVEDMQLGLHLAGNGAPPLFCPQALVTSMFPTEAASLLAQRTRWEHGHLGVIATQAPRMLWRAVTQRRLSLLAMALDLCVPPLASLALLLLGTALAALALLATTGLAGPAVLAVSLLAAFAASVLLAWHSFGRQAVSMKELLSVPAYILAKLPIYARLIGKRQAEWVRTKRDDAAR